MAVIWNTDDFYLLDHGTVLTQQLDDSKQVPLSGLFYQPKQYFTSKKLSHTSDGDVSKLFGAIYYPASDSASDESAPKRCKLSESNNFDLNLNQKWFEEGKVPVPTCSFAHDSENKGHVFPILVKLPKQITLKPHGIFNKYYHNPLHIPSILKLSNESYIIPPQSSFLLSDIEHVDSLRHFAPSQGYDLIVIDPPWKNKSVSRGKKYDTLTNVFEGMPVKELSRDYVAVWVTNKAAHVKYVVEELFDEWGIRLEAVVYWLKVTIKGVPIVPFNSPHKKPYELLIIGRKTQSSSKCSYKNIDKLSEFPSAILSNVTKFVKRSDISRTYHLNQSSVASDIIDCLTVTKQIICSVPCVQHSRKPPLTFLQDFIAAQSDSPDTQCLELFARSLVKGWHSWGNEVIKFQNLQFFTAQHNEHTYSS